MNRILDLLKYPKIIIFIIIVFVLVLFPGILNLKNDNSPKIFFANDAQALRNYEFLQKEFGGGHTVRITFKGNNLWTNTGLKWIGEVENNIQKLEYVETVVGLSARHRWMMLSWPPKDPDFFFRKLMQDDFTINAGLISKNGKIITMLIIFSEIQANKSRLLLKKITSILNDKPNGISASISGLPVLHIAMDKSLEEMAFVFLPLLGILAIIFLSLVFRRIRDVLVPLFFVGIVQILLFGLLGYFNIKLNLINIILAPLIFVISIATAVHILAYHRKLLSMKENEQQKYKLTIIQTYKNKGWPVFWTGLTTLIAFGSLTLASSPPIKVMGLWSAIGIAIMTFLAFSFYPILLLFIRPLKVVNKTIYYDNHFKKLGINIASWSIDNNKRIKGVIAFVAVIALLGITNLDIEDNMGKYLSPNNPVRIEMERLQRSGIGIFPAELILSYRYNNQTGNNTENLGFQEPESQQKIEKLAAKLRNQRYIYSVINSGDLVKAAVKEIFVEGEVTKSIRWMALGLLQSIPGSKKLLHTLLTEDGVSTRLTLLLPMKSYHIIQPLLDDAVKEAGLLFPNAKILITGEFPLILKSQSTLLDGLIISFSITLFCVFAVFFLLLGDFIMALKALIPNVWPVLLVFGTMGWSGIPLDSVSIMTASIVLGLAVDDTFHTLGHFLKLEPSSGSIEAMKITIGRITLPHILTSIILAAGFISCIFSELLPVSRMGLLASIAIVFALIGDLIIIPVLFTKKSG